MPGFRVGAADVGRFVVGALVARGLAVGFRVGDLDGLELAGDLDGFEVGLCVVGLVGFAVTADVGDVDGDAEGFVDVGDADGVADVGDVDGALDGFADVGDVDGADDVGAIEGAAEGDDENGPNAPLLRSTTGKPSPICVGTMPHAEYAAPPNGPKPR